MLSYSHPRKKHLCIDNEHGCIEKRNRVSRTICNLTEAHFIMQRLDLFVNVFHKVENLGEFFTKMLLCKVCVFVDGHFVGV